MPFDLIDRRKHTFPTLTSRSCGCGSRFQVADGEDAAGSLTARIIDDLKAGRVQTPAIRREPAALPVVEVLGGERCQRLPCWAFTNSLSTAFMRVL